MKKKYLLYSTASLIGYIIGAGIFGLPFAIQRLGFFPGVVLFGLLTLTTALNCLSLGEIILRTKGLNYFPNLVGFYLGKKGKLFEFIALIVSGFGSILAYYILGGAFLNSLFGNLLSKMTPVLNNNKELFFIIIFILIGALFIWRGIEELGKVELIMSLILGLIILVVSWKSFHKINLNNYFDYNFDQLLPAIGVSLFALDGIGGIFILRNILFKKEKLLEKSILISYITVFILSIIFCGSLVGVFGASIDPAGVIGIGSKLGVSIEKGATFFGFLAVLSSFIVVGSSLKNTFIFDFKFPAFYSWVVVWIFPLIFYIIGMDNFILLISLIGAFFGVVNTVLITILLKKAREKGNRNPEFQIKTPYWINLVIIIFYIFGLLSEINIFLN
ncbi:MAG: hypothetical protein GF335_03225 [Candidatus Moranbacteria bacterium]|nr:hypothetical protein [Candidatus Moranbacteria bacterium]